MTRTRSLDRLRSHDQPRASDQPDLHGRLIVLEGLDPALTAAKRAAGYLRDAPDEPTPSVAFLNQAIAAIALGEALNIATGWHPPRPYTLIDLGTPALTPIHATPQPDCPACGPGSPRALADAAPPPHFTQPTPPPPP